MENLISLVNKLQRACTALGDHGDESALPTLWDSLPAIAVVGGQSSGKSSVLESVVGKDFLPRGSGIVTRRPLVLQLHRIDGDREYAEFMHLPRKRFTDFALVRKEIADETDRETGRSKAISSVPIHLSIFSPYVVNLTLIDLPGLTKVAIDGQADSIVQDIENMVRAFIEKPNCIILAVSPANQDLATSDAIKISREVDPKGERTFGVLTKIDLMDKGTDAVDILEGRSYRLQFPWIGVVNRSQQDINKNVDMIAARRREREYFANTPEYKHLAHRMGSEHLAKSLSKHLETVIKSRIPGLQSLITKTIAELETELNRLGKPIANDAGGKLYTIMEICRMFDGIYKEHLDGVRPGGETREQDNFSLSNPSPLPGDSSRLSCSFPKMDTNRRQSGIQQLLAAEQEAQQIVNAARAAKLARLRQAKEEAEREIAEYRAQMEAEFQRKVAESSGDSGANVKRLEQETNEKIKQLKQQAASISPEVIQMLLRHVTTVKN